LGNVQKIKHIDTANKLIVICNCMHIFCEFIDDDENKLVDNERSRDTGIWNCLFSINADGLGIELLCSSPCSNNFSDKRFIR